MTGVIVTGATSFIGLAVSRLLLREGCRVYAVVRPASRGLPELEKIGREERRRGSGGSLVVLPCELSQIGTLTERRPVFALEGEEALSAWLHLGWDGAGSANRSNGALQARNVGYALEALKTAEALGCRRFLFTGSQAEYGVRTTRMREDDACYPVSEYGKCKCRVREEAGALAERLGVAYVHARIFSVYGPGDHPWSLIETCLDTFLGEGCMKLGPCSQLWNFLYIDDTARALLKLLLGKAAAGVYNVAGEDTRPLRAYIEELYRLCGERGSYEFGDRPPNAEGQISLMPDTERLRSEGFRQQVTFGQGIQEMLRRRQAALSPGEENA